MNIQQELEQCRKALDYETRETVIEYFNADGLTFVEEAEYGNIIMYVGKTLVAKLIINTLHTNRPRYAVYTGRFSERLIECGNIEKAAGYLNDWMLTAKTEADTRLNALIAQAIGTGDLETPLTATGRKRKWRKQVAFRETIHADIDWYFEEIRRHPFHRERPDLSQPRYVPGYPVSVSTDAWSFTFHNWHLYAVAL